MNRLITFLLATLIICPAAQAAVAITTNPVCKKLVTAINQAQNVEKCKVAWETIIKFPAIKTEDHPQIIQQALRITQEQKAVLDEELANLGDKTKDHSKIKWGAGQLALAAYLATGFTLITYEGTTTEKEHWSFVTTLFFPTLLICNSLKQKRGGILLSIGSLQFLISIPAASCLLYKGYHNLRQGLNYKQFLQDKITNLDAIISYLQDLQTNNQ